MTTSRIGQVCSILLFFPLFLAVTAISSSAQTFTLLATFHDYTNGSLPQGALVQGLEGNFYGVTYEGGGQSCNNGCGTVFKITPAGTVTTLHEFVKNEGNNPAAGLVLAANGNFYGTTEGPGSYRLGFEITSGGTLTVLNQLFPETSVAALIQDTTDGNFYGPTSQGGNFLAGGVFSMTASGTVTTIHSFCDASSCGGDTNGYAPLTSLFEDISTGKMYGTASEGGETPGGSTCGEETGCGTIFVIGTGGNLKTLHQFAGTDGYYPTAALAQGSDGNFYGTTYYGGEKNSGTAFQITPAGALTTLYNFCSLTNCADGEYPQGGLIQATDGNFYGTTSNGGSDSGLNCPCGTVFQLTAGGTLTTLHNFDNTDGRLPTATLVQGTDGNIYGTTTGRFNGSTISQGSVFKISMGLAPFVRTLPLAAYSGTEIFILGTDLTGATAVTFNGTAAAFTVVSPTEISVTVPKGATTGTVVVTVPSGTLSSNLPFRVY
jgi:uncharacterized repeat protein (TIGR03803 family)